MPLYKRKPFQLLEPPEDLDQNECVFQVRFTKEIFRDYEEYLNRLNLYRQRVWTCKVTGKTNLTYEEALVSEHRAAEKVQQIPEELVAPVLQMIQYSTLTLKDLINAIYTKLQKQLSVGLELHGKKEQSICPCKILKILEDNHYQVGWLDEGKKIIDTTVVNAEDLMHRKPPLSRYMLKAFIRKSTLQSIPWVVHEKLAKKYGISTEPPEELVDKSSIENGHLNISKNADNGRIYKKRKKTDNENSDLVTKKKMKKGTARKLVNLGSDFQVTREEEEIAGKVPIKYPIDDLLVQPAADDPIFADRPSPSTEFSVPMNCVGDLLMVWNFCSSFSRLLNLWPFSLEDFENAICHKDSELILIVETNSALLRMLLKNEGDYFMVLQNKKRKLKITQSNWTEYLCDFLGMEDRPALSSPVTTIKRGHYGLLDAHAKLSIFRELVEAVLKTNAIRGKLNECIGQRRSFSAAKREEVRKQREEQQMRREESSTEEINPRNLLENGKGNLNNFDVQENGKGLDEKGHIEKAKRMSDTEKSSKGQRRGQYVNKETREKNSREQKEHLEWEIEKLPIRTNSLGRDRNYNRYWFFRREGRIFVESSDSMQWGFYMSKEELDAFLASLNTKGERERALKMQLEKFYNTISNALQKRSKDINQRILREEGVLRRSTRVRAQPRDSQATAFLRYVNKWKGN